MKAIVKITGMLDGFIDKACSWGLFISVGLMISLTLTNIVLRWFSTTILWVEPLVRQLVFFAAFLGGIVATGSKSHISIDLVGRILETFEMENAKKIVDRLIIVFCLGAVFWLAHAGYQFMLIEMEFGKIEFLGLHSSIFVGIIPAGLVNIGFRFFHHLLASFVKE